MSDKVTAVSELERLKAEVVNLEKTREALEAKIKELNAQSGALIPEIAVRKHTIQVLERISGDGKGGD